MQESAYSRLAKVQEETAKVITYQARKERQRGSEAVGRNIKKEDRRMTSNTLTSVTFSPKIDIHTTHTPSTHRKPALTVQRLRAPPAVFFLSTNGSCVSSILTA